ncbi:MAG: hypothetical protein GY820_10390 [Gammaproteobacteria bacterium]|nr:hypothetical protein [Gammaproteobacteria bacterium]
MFKSRLLGNTPSRSTNRWRYDVEIYMSIMAFAILGFILTGFTMYGVIKQGKLDVTLMVIMFVVFVLVTTDKVAASTLLEI